MLPYNTNPQRNCSFLRKVMALATPKGQEAIFDPTRFDGDIPCITIGNIKTPCGLFFLLRDFKTQKDTTDDSYRTLLSRETIPPYKTSAIVAILNIAFSTDPILPSTTLHHATKFFQTVVTPDDSFRSDPSLLCDWPKLANALQAQNQTPDTPKFNINHCKALFDIYVKLTFTPKKVEDRQTQNYQAALKKLTSTTTTWSRLFPRNVFLPLSPTDITALHPTILANTPQKRFVSKEGLHNLTAFDIAIQHGNTTALRAMLASHYPFDDTAIITAITHNRTDILALLLKQKATIITNKHTAHLFRQLINGDPSQERSCFNLRYRVRNLTTLGNDHIKTWKATLRLIISTIIRQNSGTIETAFIRAYFPNLNDTHFLNAHQKQEIRNLISKTIKRVTKSLCSPY